jgi:hypothetical protein
MLLHAIFILKWPTIKTWWELRVAKVYMVEDDDEEERETEAAAAAKKKSIQWLDADRIEDIARKASLGVVSAAAAAEAEAAAAAEAALAALAATQDAKVVVVSPKGQPLRFAYVKDECNKNVGKKGGEGGWESKKKGEQKGKKEKWRKSNKSNKSNNDLQPMQPMQSMQSMISLVQQRRCVVTRGKHKGRQGIVEGCVVKTVNREKGGVVRAKIAASKEAQHKQSRKQTVPLEMSGGGALDESFTQSSTAEKQYKQDEVEGGYSLNSSQLHAMEVCVTGSNEVFWHNHVTRRSTWTDPYAAAAAAAAAAKEKVGEKHVEKIGKHQPCPPNIKEVARLAGSPASAAVMGVPQQKSKLSWRIRRTRIRAQAAFLRRRALPAARAALRPRIHVARSEPRAIPSRQWSSNRNYEPLRVTTSRLHVRFDDQAGSVFEIKQQRLRAIESGDAAHVDDKRVERSLESDAAQKDKNLQEEAGLWAKKIEEAAAQKARQIEDAAGGSAGGGAVTAVYGFNAAAGSTLHGFKQGASKTVESLSVKPSRKLAWQGGEGVPSNAAATTSAVNHEKAAQCETWSGWVGKSVVVKAGKYSGESGVAESLLIERRAGGKSRVEAHIDPLDRIDPLEGLKIRFRVCTGEGRARRIDAMRVELAHRPAAAGSFFAETGVGS